MFALLTTALAAIGAVTAAPAFKSTRGIAIHLTDNKTGNCSAMIEEIPWNISHLVTFKANAHPHSVSYFIFDFEDSNKGLETKTQCQYYLPEGSNSTLASEDYHGCVDSNVQFMWTGKELLVERWYQDPCLGSPPYDNAIAHGRANVNLTKIKAVDGVLSTQTHVAMPISSLS